MYVDDTLVFTKQADGTMTQALTDDAATTRVLDWALLDADIGAGKPVSVVVTITDDDFATCDSVNFILQSDTNTNFSTDKIDHAQTDDILVAALVQGARFTLRVPAEHHRYMRVFCDVTGSNNTAGRVHICLAQG